MKILFYRIIMGCVFMLYSGILSGQHWEVIRGIKSFIPDYPTTVGKYQIFSKDNTINLIPHILDKRFVYTNREWKSYDFRQELLDCSSDTAFRRLISAKDFCFDICTSDSKNDFWASYYGYAYTMNNGYILYKYGDTIKIYDKYYNRDTKTFERFGQSCCIAFDNYNTPYIIADIDVPFNEYQKLSYSNIFKIENDTMKLIAGHSVRHTLQKPQIVFDSKNNFWTFHYDSLFYYANDTLNKHFSCRYDSETMPEEILNFGHFKYIHIDSTNDLIAVHSKYILYSYKNNVWTTDTTVRQFINSIDRDGIPEIKNNKQVYIDNNNNVWILPFARPVIYKRDANSKWSYHKIPNYTNSKKGNIIPFNISPLENNRLYLWDYNFNFNGLIYYTESE